MSRATPLWVKICGLRTTAAVETAANAGASAVGLVFHEPSPRNVTLAQARELRQAVPPGVECVAVFMHPSQALVDAVIDAIGPQWLQTDADDLTALRVPGPVRLLPVLRSGHEPRLQALPQRCLLESARSGAGELADWADAATMARGTQLVLAGGLQLANVAEAVRTVRPFGVDVSSGVERERGVKDLQLIRDFIRAARDAGRDLPVEENRR